LHCEEDADVSLYYAAYPLRSHKLGFAERVGYRNRLRFLERHGIQRSDNILDYGCGVGLFVDYLQEQGLKCAFGYDPFTPEFNHPRSLQPPFHAVVSYDVIEHYDDPREFMRCAGGLVRPGGLLVIGTPNADHVRTDRPGDPSLHVPYHRHILSEQALLNMAREHSFEPVEIHRRSFFDSLVPTVNSRFMWRYLDKAGGLDAAVEPPRVGMVLGSPELLFLAFFGYFLPAHDWMMVSFRRIPKT
jgi:SAM-dependent methyltransferase